jgi:hypothetical protein
MIIIIASYRKRYYALSWLLRLFGCGRRCSEPKTRMSISNGRIDPIAFSNHNHNLGIQFIILQILNLLGYVMIHGHGRMHMAPLHKEWCYLPNYTSLTAHPFPNATTASPITGIRPLHCCQSSVFIHKWGNSREMFLDGSSYISSVVTNNLQPLPYSLHLLPS